MPSGVYVASVEGMVTDDVFAVIAEATRRDILVSLREGDKAVGELVQELEASQPTISKHLKVLREAALDSIAASVSAAAPVPALPGVPAGGALSPAVALPVGTAGEDKRPQQIGRTVGRAATRAADLLANLPKFGRKK